MALQVGLIHAVETVVVEHCVHLCLAGVVAGTYGVHVGLLHHHHIFEHCLYIDCTSCYRVCVLQVSSLEENSLSVDVYKSVLDLYVTETVFSREYVLLVSCSILLCNDYCVKVRGLCSPWEQAVEVELCICNFSSFACIKSHFYILSCNLIAVRCVDDYCELLACCNIASVVH